MNKRIGNIYLVWRKGAGHRRIVVGEIKSNSSEGVRFSYIRKNLEEAKKQGFTPYTGFPDFDKVYTENVIDIFAHRIVKSERNDVSDFYKFWKVDIHRREDAFYMLAQTQGLLPIDNFEFLADFNPIEGLTFVSEIAGLSIYNPPIDCIQLGQQLSFKLEPHNLNDGNAVILSNNSLKLGYVKAIHLRVFYKSKRGVNVKIHHIEKNGVIKRVFILISIRNN